MRTSDGPGADTDRRLELQNEIDAIVAEIGRRRRKRSRSWAVALASVFVAVALLYSIDFIGLPNEIVVLGATLPVFYTVGSAVWAEMTSIGFFTSAKDRLEALTARLES